MRPRRTPAAQLHLSKAEAELLQQLLEIEPGYQLDLGGSDEAWLAVWQRLLRRRLVVVYRGGSGSITEAGRYALDALRRRRVQPAFYRGRVCSSRFHSTDLVRAVAELRARVCPARRAKRGSVHAVWATGSSQLVLSRTLRDGRYREAWYWVHPDVLERVRTELPAEPALVSRIGAAWHPPAATAERRQQRGEHGEVD